MQASLPGAVPWLCTPPATVSHRLMIDWLTNSNASAVILAERFQPVGLVGVDFALSMQTEALTVDRGQSAADGIDGTLRAVGRRLDRSQPPRSLRICHAFPQPERADAPADGMDMGERPCFFAAAPTPVSQLLIECLTRETSPWTQADGGWPSLADIPRPGQVIAAGAPVVTVFAAASTTDDALNQSLRSRRPHRHVVVGASVTHASHTARRAAFPCLRCGLG
jgi:hypothetical protein